MMIYKKMREDILVAKEGIEKGYRAGPQTILEYVKAQALVDIAESLDSIDGTLANTLAHIAESLAAIRAGGSR